MTNHEYAKSIISLLTNDLLASYREAYGDKAPNMFFLTRCALNTFIISQKLGNLKTLGVHYPDDVMYAINDLIDTMLVILAEDISKEDIQPFIESFKTIVGDLVHDASYGSLSIDDVTSKIDTLKGYLS